MTLFLYETGPIDHWVGWTPIEDHLATIDRQDQEGREQLFRFLYEALSHARNYSHWEGDIRFIYVSGLPPIHGDPTCALMLGWKQGNNGTSFIASEIELPHLAEALVVPVKRSYLERLKRIP